MIDLVGVSKTSVFLHAPAKLQQEHLWFSDQRRAIRGTEIVHHCVDSDEGTVRSVKLASVSVRQHTQDETTHFTVIDRPDGFQQHLDLQDIQIVFAIHDEIQVSPKQRFQRVCVVETSVPIWHVLEPVVIDDDANSPRVRVDVVTHVV